MEHLQFQSVYAPVFQIQGDLEGFQIEKMKSEDLRHWQSRQHRDEWREATDPFAD